MQLDRPLAVITPAVDADVLAVLAWRREVTSTAGQIQYYLGRHSTEGIRRSLRRLAEQGVVVGKRLGNTSAYQLNLRHLATPAIIELASGRDRFVAALANQFDEWVRPPVYAALFGAAARGSMAVQDEIDLFIALSDGGLQPELDRQFDDLADSVQAWTGNRANIVALAEGEAVRRTDDDDLLAVRRRGLRVYGSPSWVEYQFLRAYQLAQHPEAPGYSQSRLRNDP